MASKDPLLFVWAPAFAALVFLLKLVATPPPPTKAIFSSKNNRPVQRFTRLYECCPHKAHTVQIFVCWQLLNPSFAPFPQITGFFFRR